jgi:hypothetical protein
MPENGQRPGTQYRPKGPPLNYVPIDQCMENGEARIPERLWAERQLPEDLGIHLDKVRALEICKQEGQRPRCRRAVQPIEDLPPVQYIFAVPQQIDHIHHGDHGAENRDAIIVAVPMGGDIDQLQFIAEAHDLPPLEHGGPELSGDVVEAKHLVSLEYTQR